MFELEVIGDFGFHGHIQGGIFASLEEAQKEEQKLQSQCFNWGSSIIFCPDGQKLTLTRNGWGKETKKK